MAPTQEHRFISIGTALGDDKLLIRNFSMTEQLGRLSQIEVELQSQETEIDFGKIIGTNATVRLRLPNGKTRYFNGVISRFVQTQQERAYARYRATIVPWLWFLTRTSDCRIFQNKKAPDIIEEVFKAHGFADYKLQLTGSYREWEYCVQYRETDFNFVSRLMEQEGMYYYFKHEDGVHALILVDSKDAHQSFEDYDSIPFRPQRHQGEEPEETVTNWTIEQEIQPGVYALSDFSFKTPGSAILVNANKDRPHEAAGFEIFDYPGEYEKRAEGEAYAKLRMEELQAQHEILRGQATARGLCAGCKFELEGHPRNDQNREHLVTSASYQASGGEYESGASEGAGEFFSCSFTAIPLAEPFRSPRITPKPLIQGPQTAFVVGQKGEEIYTDEFGRVKVKFHWDRLGKADEKASCWVRVSQACAGKGWGAFNLPRVGQEVIVEFLEGNPDRPIITGRVYNAAAVVPYPLPSHKTITTFKSNSSKGGAGFNEIRFEDKKGEEQIFIHAQKNQDIRIKNDAFEFIGNDCHLIVKKDQFEHVENNRSETVDKDHMEKIGKDRHLKIVGKEAKEVGESHSFVVKGDVIEVFKANHSEQTTQDYYLKAANVVIEAMTNVTIKVGAAYIAIEASGIKISAPQIQFEGTAMAEMKSPMTTVKGHAILTLKGGMTMIN